MCSRRRTRIYMGVNGVEVNKPLMSRLSDFVAMSCSRPRTSHEASTSPHGPVTRMFGSYANQAIITMAKSVKKCRLPNNLLPHYNSRLDQHCLSCNGDSDASGNIPGSSCQNGGRNYLGLLTRFLNVNLFYFNSGKF